MIRRWVPGLTGVAVIAMLAYAAAASKWCESAGLSALTLAILFGMVIGNTIYPKLDPAFEPGITFAKQKLLRLGIVLYGLRLTLQDLAHVGVRGILIDAVVLTLTFALALLLGIKVFKLERNTAILIGAGSAICGAAAVMATEPVVRGRSDQVAIAIATVVVFGTAAMFAYPMLYHLAVASPAPVLSQARYGIFAGSTIHEVAQVLIAGRAVSDAAANTAVIEKLGRVMMLAPFLMLLSAWFARTDCVAAGQPRNPVTVPWFAVLFVLMACFNSLHWLPNSWLEPIAQLDTFALTMAMAALGLTTTVSAIVGAGLRPLGLGAALFVWLVAGGAAINATAGLVGR